MRNEALYLAIKDISTHLKEQKINVFDDNKDIWHVFPSSLNTSENKRLNKLLGIHKINKFGSRSSKKLIKDSY